MLTAEDTNNIIEERMKEMLDTYGRKAYMLMSEILMLKNSLQQQVTTRLIYLSEWDKYHSKPTISAMRNLINRRKENGMEEYGVLSKDRKLWLIDEQKFFEWRKSNNPKEIKVDCGF